MDMAQVYAATAVAIDSEVSDLIKLVAVLKTMAADESGATMVEYAIMGGLTATLLVLAILGVSDMLTDVWAYVASMVLGEIPFAT